MSGRAPVVGFVGLGVMGEPMAANVAAGGFDLLLHDADPARATEIAERLQATAVDGAGLAACDVVVCMLPTSGIVRAVLMDDDGALRVPLRAGAVVVDMSSSDPSETVETGRLLREAGVAMVDAPVSGARERAVAGSLAIMLGGDDEDAIAAAVPVIEAMSSTITRTGGLGTGHAMKALNNFVAAAAFAASSEALIAGARFGLDRRVMLDILNLSTGMSWVTTNVTGPHILDGAYASGFALPLMTKDVRIAQQVQRAVDHDAPVCDAVVEALGSALDALGPVDHTRAYEHWERR